MSERLDQALLARELVRSRNQGREFILAGLVRVDGAIRRKPAFQVDDDSELELLAAAHRHRVGRGYDKLAAFLAGQPVRFAGRLVVDGGASSGGFTQLALERGAGRVIAVELGHGQLAAELLADPRVRSLERTDLLTVTALDAPCELLLLDLSFVSLTAILPGLRLSLAPAAELIALVKPQFELESSRLTAAGRPRRSGDAEAALASVLDCAEASGWTILATDAVEPGPDQRNREFFVHARRTQGESE